MAERGLRGPVGSFLFMDLRLLNDQTLENATGVGAPPWTWPVDEQVIDLLQRRSTLAPMLSVRTMAVTGVGRQRGDGRSATIAAPTPARRRS